MIEGLIGDFCLKVTQCLQEVKDERLLSQWAWMDLVRQTWKIVRRNGGVSLR